MRRFALTCLLATAPVWAAAGPTTGLEAPGLHSSITQLILLGTQGGPRQTGERAEPANLVIVRGKPYLIDAGNGVVRQLALAHYQPTDIHQIFITHNHDDHNADWGTLMGLAWTNGNISPITVYGPVGTRSMLKGYLQYFAPNAASHWMESSQVPPANTMRAVDYAANGLVYQDENIKVTAVENCHYHFAKGTPGYGWQKSYSLRIQTPDRVVVFSGDTGDCGHVVSDFARDADVLVHEVIDLAAVEQRLGSEPGIHHDALMEHMRREHSSPEQVGRTASDAHVKLVVLSHLVLGTQDDGSTLVQRVKLTFSGPVVLGQDLMRF